MTLDSILDSCDVLKYIISVWFCGVAIVIAKHPSSISVAGVKKRVLQIETCKKPAKKGAIFPSKASTYTYKYWSVFWAPGGSLTSDSNFLECPKQHYPGNFFAGGPGEDGGLAIENLRWWWWW